MHRLMEFAMFVLPFTGGAHFTQELHFEKTHQSLKSSVERSNRHAPHLFAMQNIIFDDWKGRLSLVDIETTPLSRTDALAAIRLLGGDEYNLSHVSESTSAQVLEILQCMGVGLSKFIHFGHIIVPGVAA